MGLLVLAVLASACGSEVRPDVVLVVVDTLRADGLGLYGYPRATSPNLDALARESVVFDRAYSPATWTKPAIASLFTALLPAEHGILRLGSEDDELSRIQRLPASLPTLAERFRDGGYATLAVLQQPNLGEVSGFARGFETFDHQIRGDAFALVAALLAHLDRVDRKRPTFAYLHLLDPHWPYAERLADLPLDAFGPLTEEDPLPAARRALRRNQRLGLPVGDVGSLRARYDHGVAWTDRALGGLVASLRRRTRWSSTLLVITADHGESFLEHDRLQHSHLPYEEVTRIPLIVRAPRGAGIDAGRRASPVSLAELGPTLLELAGLPAWSGVSAESFAEIARGRERPERVVLSQAFAGRALRSLDYRLLVPVHGKVALFDLRTDPTERRNLAATGCYGRCEELLAGLRHLEAALRPPVAREYVGDGVPQEELEQLRALGYL